MTPIDVPFQGADEALVARVDGAARARPGERIGLGVGPGGCHLLAFDDKALPRRVRHPLAA